MSSCYGVTTWHGELGSIAYVVVNATGEIVADYTTGRNGGEWRTLANEHAVRLNRAEAAAHDDEPLRVLAPIAAQYVPMTDAEIEDWARHVAQKYGLPNEALVLYTGCCTHCQRYYVPTSSDRGLCPVCEHAIQVGKLDAPCVDCGRIDCDDDACSDPRDTWDEDR